MKQLSTLTLEGLLVIVLVIGGVAGYLAASQLNKSPVSQSAFLPYADTYGGPIDDSQIGFVRTAPLVAGFSQGSTGQTTGRIAWYWLIGGTGRAVNPVYFFQYQSGGAVSGQLPIIDAKPGDTGYTHFWEIWNVTVPNSYQPNTIKSLSTLNRAQQAGLVTILDAKRVLNGPLVTRNVRITVVNGEPLFLTAWYRDKTTEMAVFETNLPSGSQTSIPIWLVQKDSRCPLLEAVCNSDLNHDSDIKDSNDLIGPVAGQSGYFPLWAVSILHVYNNTYHPNGSPYLPLGFPSPFPQDPAALKSTFGMFTSFADAQADQAKATPTYVDLTCGGASGCNRGVTDTGNLVNCPALPAGVEPPGIQF